MEQNLCLEIKNLSTLFKTRRGVVRAVNDLSLRVGRGELLGLVGESGCGKSVTLLSILRLIPYPGEITHGRILFEGEDLLKKISAEMRKIRGMKISMVFQDPMTTLNPVFKVGEQIRESLVIHGLIQSERENGFLSNLFGSDRRKEQYRRVIGLMEQVGIPSPEARYFEYPHQFSGGMQQRGLIAIALACNPSLILADEPTTALDVTIQAQILELLKRINREKNTSIILVTHNLGVASEFCHRIAVMYAGRIVEIGRVDDVIQNPLHPYTKGLLNSIPKITKEPQKIEPIPGNVPDLIDLPGGCAFNSRCTWSNDHCHEEPEWKEMGEGHFVRCLLYQ
ncbi:MAG: methionine ABC transporter ATP-binding protein [Deltaproteobacteria bacterium RBG_16_48_10]|nr:MAG: methionine ABC transporter ATP-binding protein [Deltaproteobacteria bacterium RBG_16_48_10]